ncbi:MAG: ImuA family protein [Geminicoccaceae bacterium]
MKAIGIRSDQRHRLAELRRRIEVIERGSFRGLSTRHRFRESAAEQGSIGLFDPLGSEGDGQGRSDQCVTSPALHELVADGYGNLSAVRDVGLLLAASLLERQSGLGAKPMVLWCQRQKDDLEFGRLYGPGLKTLGLSPDQFVMVTGRRDADCLWAMEQGVGSASLAAVIGVVDRADLIASRRLSLAAAAHRTWCFLLPVQYQKDPSAALTRWRVKAVPSISERPEDKLPGQPRWQLTLERSRNGRHGHWTMEWDHAAHRFRLVDPMADRPAAVARRNSRDVAGRNNQDKDNAGVLAFKRTG